MGQRATPTRPVATTGLTINIATDRKYCGEGPHRSWRPVRSCRCKEVTTTGYGSVSLRSLVHAGVSGWGLSPPPSLPAALTVSSVGTVTIEMTGGEREAFLADVHVGVVSVARQSLGPLTVPVWYTYTPGGVVSVITGAGTRKARLIAAAGRLSLCAQSEVPPYKYVSVEGPVTSTEAPVDPDEARLMAYRYLGQEFGDLYLEATAEGSAENCIIRMTPESWFTSDFAKEY